jgi:hypothetical protein
MLLHNALIQLSTMPGHIARRPSGVMLQIKERMQIVTFRTGRERRWCPKFRDQVADDWEIVSIERLIQETQLMQQQAELVAAVEANTDTEANDVEPIG